MSTNQQNFITPLTSTGNSNYDPYYSNVTLLLPMNGVNGSTSFPDASINTKTVTANGNTQISTTQSKFGGSSAYFDGSGDSLSTPYTTANYDWWTSDFTIEAWVYASSFSTWSINAAGSTIPKMIGNMDTAGTVNYWSFGPDSTSKVKFYYYNGAQVHTAISTETLSLNGWNHIAMVKTSAGIKLFANGIGTSDIAISGTPQSSAGINLTVGQYGQSLTGYVDDLRITKGIARYTANFTPPAFANPLTGAMYDPFYNNVSLLLHCNGVNGSTNFIDNSSSAKTVTVNGNTVLSSTQWKFNRSSAYFDGNGDYLELADSADFELSSGDFTVECWIYLTAYSPTYSGAGAAFAAQIINKDTLNDRGWYFYVYGTSTSWTSLSVTLFPNNTTPTATTGSFTFALNTWYHVAAARNGTSLRLYVNGVDVGGGTNSTTVQNTATALQIGSQSPYWASVGYGYYFPGYIDDLRITKGVARYTGSFTPPKLPFPDTGIQIDPYYDQTILLLPMNGANASTSFIDSSTTAKIITVNGNTQISTTQSKFGGSSAYFDGTTDSLSISAATTYDIFSSDFTVEFFVFFSGSTNNQCLFQIGSNNLNRANVSIASNLILVYSAVAGVGGTQISATAPAINTWHHVAWVKSGTTTSLYVNGVSVGTPVTGVSYPSGSMSLSIGADQINSGANCLLGYIDNLRVTKGVARYTSSFTVPVQPNPTTGILYDNYYNNVSLLLRMDGSNSGTSFIDSSPRAKAITVNGNTITSTTQYKYGISSAYFDGTGDYLSFVSTTDFGFGLDDFTWEAWIYPVVITGNDRAITDFRTSAASPGTLFIDAALGNRLAFWYGSKLGGTGTVLNTNTWYHVVLTRSSGVFRCFLNGILDWQASATVDFGSTRPLGIGAQAVGPGVEPGSSPFNGYIDDVRITKGIARYTANFTPPTQAVPNQGPATDPYYSNTVLLLHCNGTNASTNFVDNSPVIKSVAANGNAQISTTQSKFGGSSAYFDGNGDYLTCPVTGIINFGSGDFTVEGWVYVASYPDSQTTIISNYGSSGQRGFDVRVQSNHTIGSRFSTNGSTDAFSVASPAGALNTWQHFAVVRNGSSYTAYLNGVSGTSVNVGTSSVFAPTTQAALIGGTPDTGPGVWWFNGYIDDLRVTKGVARYINNFTPPQQAFPNFGPIPSAYPQIL